MSVTGKSVELKSMGHILGHVRGPGTAAKCGLLVRTGENSRASHSKVKEVLLTEETYSTGRVQAILEGRRGSRVRGGQFLSGWVVS